MPHAGDIIRFRIDAWTPATLPMARLGEYMQLVAELYGESGSVHFKALKKGSAVIESRVETEAVPKVVARLELVKTSAAPEPLKKLYNRIDEMLRSDNATGTISRPRVGRVVDFPGRKAARPEPIFISQPTTVDGVVVRIGGLDETIPLSLQDFEGQTYNCTIRGRERARSMAKYLFGSPIRVQGTGKWERTTEGAWILHNLFVTDHEELDADALPETIAQLRQAAREGWPSGAAARWKKQREE